MSTEILKKRIKLLKKSDYKGECVIYVMSRDQRVSDNHALIAAQKHAIAKKLPLAVVFNVLTKSGFRTKEHYEFMLQGLREVELKLIALNIPFILTVGNAFEQIGETIKTHNPDAIYFDFNPLNGPRKLQIKLADKFDVSMYVVDTHNIIPVWQASDKQEVAAYTLRPKIHRLLEEYLLEPENLVKHPYVWNKLENNETLKVTIQNIVDNTKQSGINISCESGEKAAEESLNKFIESKLVSYVTDRNNPSLDRQSGLSPYLHFGQISSLRIALELRNLLFENSEDLHILKSSKMPKSKVGLKASVDALLEEMIVRKELSDNFCYYNQNYDNIEGAPDWAIKTLTDHNHDPREFLYSLEQLENAQTHDKAWNAAQMQMKSTGKMHGYMRMYWAKKVLEWTESPEKAIDNLIKLNDTYSIDGGDPNGYTGIMWSVCGVHDRPWTERDVFGKIRYMNYGGLKRKFDIEQYVNTWL